MDEMRIKEIFSDEAFVKRLLDQEEPEQIQAVLKEKGIELNFEEIEYMKSMVEKMLSGEADPEELSDDDLNDVSGGAVGAAIGIILSVAGILITSAQWVDTEMRSRRRRW